MPGAITSRAQLGGEGARHAPDHSRAGTAKSRESNRFSRVRNHLLTVLARCCRRGFRVAEPTVTELSKQVADAQHAGAVGPDGPEHRLDAGDRLPGDVHAGRVRAGRDRADAREERRPHDGDELPGLLDRHPRLLGDRLRPADGRGRGAVDVRQRRDAVAASSSSTSRGKDFGLFGTQGLLPDARRSTRRRSRRCSCSRWCSWTPRRRSRPARWPSAGGSRRSCSSAS